LPFVQSNGLLHFAGNDDIEDHQQRDSIVPRQWSEPHLQAWASVVTSFFARKVALRNR